MNLIVFNSIAVYWCGIVFENIFLLRMMEKFVARSNKLQYFYTNEKSSLWKKFSRLLQLNSIRRCVCSGALVARQYIIKWLRSCMCVFVNVKWLLEHIARMKSERDGSTVHANWQLGFVECYIYTSKHYHRWAI